MFLTCLCTYFIVHAFMKTSSLKKRFVLQSLLLKKSNSVIMFTFMFSVVQSLITILFKS